MSVIKQPLKTQQNSGNSFEHCKKIFPKNNAKFLYVRKTANIDEAGVLIEQKITTI